MTQGLPLVATTSFTAFTSLSGLSMLTRTPTYSSSNIPLQSEEQVRVMGPQKYVNLTPIPTIPAICTTTCTVRRHI